MSDTVGGDHSKEVSLAGFDMSSLIKFDVCINIYIYIVFMYINCDIYIYTYVHGQSPGKGSLFPRMLRSYVCEHGVFAYLFETWTFVLAVPRRINPVCVYFKTGSKAFWLFVRLSFSHEMTKPF